MKRFSAVKVVIAIGCVLSLNQPLAIAQEKPDQTSECSASSQMATTQVGTKISFAEEKNLLEKLSNGLIPHNANLSEINISETVSIPNAENLSVYRIPINGDFSGTNYIIVQLRDDDVIKVAEAHITQISEDQARVQVWLDGVEKYDKIVDESAPIITPRGVRDAVGKFNSCLSNAGIPMAVVTGISIVCGLIGAASFGTGATACVIGAAGIYSGTVSFCYGRALKALQS